MIKRGEVVIITKAIPSHLEGQLAFYNYPVNSTLHSVDLMYKYPRKYAGRYVLGVKKLPWHFRFSNWLDLIWGWLFKDYDSNGYGIKYGSVG